MILELNEGTHWFWRADIDAHGSTTNVIAMAYPGRWKTTAINDDDGDNAQWTRVSTSITTKTEERGARSEGYSGYIMVILYIHTGKEHYTRE